MQIYSFFLLLVCPRIRNARESTDIMSCFVPARPRLRFMNMFCENPLVYARFTRDEFINNNRYCVVLPALVVSVYFGPCMRVPLLFGQDIVRGVYCSRCDHLIGYLKRHHGIMNCFFNYSLVGENWRVRDNYLTANNQDSDSGNDTDTDVEYDDSRSIDSGLEM